MDLPTKKRNIKGMWEQLNNDGAKTSFIKSCSIEFDRSKKTIRQYWFSNHGDWSVPEDFQDRVIEMLQNKIMLQNSGLVNSNSN